MGSINDSTREHAKWLEEQLTGFGGVDLKALKKKHKKMREDGDHNFLRATFYRWAERWLHLEKAAPVVLSAGDIHVENFGTWRSGDGALVWGINDVDEACRLPWLSDLTRLAVSVRLALTENHDPRGVTADTGCAWVLEAYTQGMTGETPTQPVLITKDHCLFRLVDKLILSRSIGKEVPGGYWEKEKGKKITVTEAEMPEGLGETLRGALPGGATVEGFLVPDPDKKPPGNGSRGKRRFYVLARESAPSGATLMDEAKPAVRSAVSFAAGQAGIPEDPSRSGVLAMAAFLESPHRVPDPTQTLTSGWLLRGISPDADKFDFDDLAAGLESADELRCLLTCMGGEVAALHRASVGEAVRQAILQDLEVRSAADGEWFLRLAEEHAEFVREDRAAFTFELP